jgi:hypothetical protein
MIFGSLVLAQDTVKPQFEVASVKPSKVTAGSWWRFLPGGRLDGLILARHPEV